MQQFLKFIIYGLSTAQHVSGVLMSIIRSSTTAVAASGFTVGACSGRLTTSPTTINSTAITTLQQ